MAWHLASRHFVRALREIRAEVRGDRGRPPAAQARGEDHRRVLPQTVEGDPNYNIHRWLEAEGAEVYPAGIAVGMDYLLRLGLQRFEDYAGIERGAR